jgi:putative tryptophan/tyrosine transport system substrate-binding protein
MPLLGARATGAKTGPAGSMGPSATTSRRALLASGAAAALVHPARAQTRRQRLAVIMGLDRGDEGEARLRAFRVALEALGWRPENLELDVVWAGGDPAHIRLLTEEALAAKPDLVLATATPIATALRARTATVPVVFVNLVDPIGSQLIGSFAAPGTNFTGLTNTEPALAGKWLELLREAAPRVRRVGLLLHPTGSPFGPFRQALEEAAASFGVSVFDLPVEDPAGIGPAVARCRGDETGLVVMTDLFTSTHHGAIAAAALAERVPGIYPYRFFVAKGGLMSYSANLLDLYARAAGYADRVLRGAKPAEMPVQTPTKYQLVVNLRTAAALGLPIPPTIAARADEFIEEAAARAPSPRP